MVLWFQTSKCERRSCEFAPRRALVRGCECDCKRKQPRFYFCGFEAGGSTVTYLLGQFNEVHIWVKGSLRAPSESFRETQKWRLFVFSCCSYALS